MARRLDHRRGQQQLGERRQRLHQQEGQGETTSVDTPAGQVAAPVSYTHLRAHET